MQVNQVDAAHIRQLVARAKDGDREAFDGLVELYTPRIYNLALRITGSREEAEDCVQDAFLRTFAALGNFRGEAAFSTWLYRVAINVAAEAARKRARGPLAASELARNPDDEAPDLEQAGRTTESGSPTPDEVVAAKERREIVLEAIRSLPEHHRTVVVLYDLQGLSYEEIARLTKTRVGTVKSRLSRARLALKERLAAHLELLRG